MKFDYADVFTLYVVIVLESLETMIRKAMAADDVNYPPLQATRKDGKWMVVD